MKRKEFYRRAIATALMGAVLLGSFAAPGMAAASEEDTQTVKINVEDYVETLPTLTVDMKAETGDILHGASGFLYGISNEDVPTTNTLVPLKSKVLATKGALGTEHPYGDALDVAETFLSGGGEQVMMYNSNYYGVFGVTANYLDYAKVLETEVAPYVYQWKQEWKRIHGTPEAPKDELGKIDIDKAIIYLPINEGTPVNGAPNTNVAWKAYYDAIKKGDPDATLAGPNSCAYNAQFVNTDFRGHIQYCADNDCMPDIITWHELQTDKLYAMSEHMDDFKNIWANVNWTKWSETHTGRPKMPQIVINEYAEMKDCGVPGALVNWIARLEDEKIYGCLPFWQQANNLNGLTSDANEGASAWWVYKWYGDMSGKTLDVTTSTAYHRLYGVATLDTKKQSASVLLGGEDGLLRLVLNHITDTDTFRGADKVHVKVQKAEYNGYAGTVNETQVILEGAYAVKNGNVEILLPNATYADAFYVTVTVAGDEEKTEEPVLQSYSKIYDAEKTELGKLKIKSINDYSPTYYFYNGQAVFMSKKGDELTYEIEIPADGNYDLNFLYGNGTGSNRNNMNSHNPKNVKQQFIIDGEALEPAIMENTLFTAITDSYCINRDLKAGKHVITVKNLENASLIHDALRVTYEGRWGSGNDRKIMVYEAEQADFNMLAGRKETKVFTETVLKGYSGHGYVTGMEENSVENGGGIRYNVVVKDSGIYNISLCYQAERQGNITLYAGNTVTTLDSVCTTFDVADTKGTWAEVTKSVYLQKGINIVDIDADVKIALDYMKVVEVFDAELAEGTRTEIEAEDCIPLGATTSVKESEGASAGAYVVGMEGAADAGDDKNKYLEFTYDAKQDGIYALALFQSNNDICGSHSYNIKIIDKYATIMVKDAKGEVTSEKRYFFINSFSDDTFKEKTVYVKLNAGMNTIRIYNDDSWHVTWGGSTSTPGTNKLYNFAPNFDKFVITKTVLEKTVDVNSEINKEKTVLFGGIDAEEYIKNEVLARNAASVDKSVAYFVDCGDHNTKTLSAGDFFGTNNSVTDKLYGPDLLTGYNWGVIFTEEDPENPRGDGAVNTQYQWANEWDLSDGLRKTSSFRYAHGQLEAGIKQRYVKYLFELEPGEYEVEVCMGNTWGNSANPDVYVDDAKINDGKLAIGQGQNKIVSKKITLEHRQEVLVAAYSANPTINMNYIKIKTISLYELPAKEPPADETNVDEKPADETETEDERNGTSGSENAAAYIMIAVVIVAAAAIITIMKAVKKK